MLFIHSYFFYATSVANSVPLPKKGYGTFCDVDPSERTQLLVSCRCSFGFCKEKGAKRRGFSQVEGHSVLYFLLAIGNAGSRTTLSPFSLLVFPSFLTTLVVATYIPTTFPSAAVDLPMVEER